MRPILPRPLKVVAALLLAVASALAAGCSASTPHPSPLPADQQIMRIGLVTNGPDIHTLDPAQAIGPNESFVTSLIFPPLLAADDTLRPEPWAAANMPIFDPVANTYTFQLKPNLKWSDGTPIDAATYAYSLNRTLNPCTFSPIAYYLFPINDAQTFANETCGRDGKTIKGKIQSLIGDSLMVIGSQTLVITLTAPAPYFLAALTTPAAFAQPEQLIAQYGRRDWTDHLHEHGGFGGNLFVVKSWYNGQLDLACLSACRTDAFPRWGRHTAPPTLREVDFTFYQTPRDEYADYAAGNLDEDTVPSASDRVSMNGSAFREVPALAITYFQPNWARPPFDDLRVRQAFALALDKDALARQIGLTPTNHIVPQGMYGYDADLVELDGSQHTTGNVALAWQLMQSYADEQCGGQLSKCPPIVIPNGGPCPSGDISTITYEQAAVRLWRQAFPGYRITLDMEDFSFPPGTPCPSPQLIGLTWFADYADPQDWLSLRFGPGALDNPGSVHVPGADTLMTQADQDFDASERVALYNEAEQILVLNVAWIPIGQGETLYNIRSTVEGFAVTGLGYPSLDQMYQIQMVKQ